MRIAYTKYRPNDVSKLVIARATDILDSYARQGFQLTLRQLYYQFVARGHLPNTQEAYGKLGVVISRAREAGLVDWSHLQDRSRRLNHRSHWDSPADIIQAVSHSYGLDLWSTQPTRVEVWVEKEALEQVVGKAANLWDVAYFANKGYVSTTAMWEAAHNRFLQYKNHSNQDTIILHLGDHDPSGVQMSEDIERRLNLFSRGYEDNGSMLKRPSIEVRRIALNMDQVRQYDPPPNPAKQTDSRYKQYCDQFGITDSWELDALEPQVIVDLIDTEIQSILVRKRYDRRLRQQERQRKQLQRLATNWGTLSESL